MNKQEFTKRVGEKHADDFEDANALYMALPNMDKDNFCTLYLLETDAHLPIFTALRKYLQAYNTEARSNQVFALFARPFHESATARELERDLRETLAAVRNAVTPSPSTTA